MLLETVMIANGDALRHLIKASAYRSNRSCSQNTINGTTDPNNNSLVTNNLLGNY